MALVNYSDDVVAVVIRSEQDGRRTRWRAACARCGPLDPVEDRKADAPAVAEAHIRHVHAGIGRIVDADEALKRRGS